MKIPSHIKVGGAMYNVIFVDEISEANPEVDGNVNFSKQTIKLKNGGCEEYLEQTFLHELLHILFDFCYINIDKEQEENVVERLSKALYQVLKDNDINFR